MERIFGKKGIYFLEHTETRRWIEEVTPLSPITTIDPLKAMRFETMGQAMTFSAKNELKNYMVTEHEFPDAATA